MTSTLSKLNDMLNSGNFAKAEILLYDLLKNNPRDYHFLKFLGISLLAQKKYKGAIESFEQCHQQDKKDFDVTLNLSFIFINLQDHENCILYANKTIALNPDIAGAYQNLGRCKLELLDFEGAKKDTEKAIELMGGVLSDKFLNYSDLINLYADILLAKKDHDEFVNFACKILDTGKFYGDLFSKLQKHDKKKIKANYLETVEAATVMLESYQSNLNRRASVAIAHICLAEHYHSTNKNLSEEHYIKANFNIAAMQRSSLYSHQKIFLNLINFFDGFDESDIKNHIDPEKGAGLIFVVGMPRSGTTLTESILSTANNIKPGGEKIFFPNNLWNIFPELKTGKLLNPDFIQELGDRYLDTIAMQRDGCFFFIDKLPANFLYFKFIHLCFPKAKFVHTYRDPWDNAISLFKANFQDTISYSTSFFGIGNYYANYLALMKFWKKKYGNAIFFDAEYESLVSKTEDTTAQLWEYCGLQGSFSLEKRKDHYAQTASQQQVSKDIYMTSLKKKEFEAYKSEFHDSLEQQNEFWRKKGI